MNIYLVVSFLVITTNARPDVSLIPSGSYLPGGNIIDSTVSGVLGTTLLETGIGGNLGSTVIGGHHLGGGYHKQVHFFAAPDELHERLRIYIAPNSARNTKIIFIKAPSFGALKPEVIAPGSATEDKTKIYVLLKKPEHGGAITIPSTLTTRPTKPDVFFIKYRTEQEAAQVLTSGLQEHNIGPTAPDLGNAQSFLGTLRSDVPIGGIADGVGSIVGTGVGDVGGVSGSGISGPLILGGINGGIIESDGKLHGPVGVSGPYRR